MILATMDGICVIFFSISSSHFLCSILHEHWFVFISYDSQLCDLGFFISFIVCLRCFRSLSFLFRSRFKADVLRIEYAVVDVLSRDRSKSEQHINGINTQMKYPLNLANVNWFEYVCKRSFMLYNQFCWIYTMALLQFSRCGFDSRFGSIRS